MLLIQSPTLFPLGKVVATPSVLEKVSERDINDALSRHAHGDWGIMPDEDKQSNDSAVKGGDRIFSAYRSHGGVKFWIITEWDRSATTILLPEEY